MHYDVLGMRILPVLFHETNDTTASCVYIFKHIIFMHSVVPVTEPLKCLNAGMKKVYKHINILMEVL